MATLKAPFALDRSLNTTEVTPRNIADVLAEGLSHITGRTASEVEYDNTDSGLTADNVQDALDEIAESVPTLPSVDIQTAVDEFSTYNGGLLSECKVTLEPNQNLHGYAEPWVGGAGKNKLPLTLANIKSANTAGTWSDNVYTIYGMTYTVNTDDGENVTYIEANGTPSDSNGQLSLNKTAYLSGSFIGNGCPSGGGSNKYRIRFAGGLDGNDFGSQTGAMTADPNTAINVYIRVDTGFTADHLKFYPMLRLSTESDATFAPYSNICPISGHTQVDVDVSDGQTTQEQVTVNLGGTYYSGTLDVVTGVFVATHVMWSDDGSKNWARNADGSFYVFYTDTHPLAVQDAEGCSCDYAPFVLSFDGMSVFARANGLVSLGRGWGNIYPDVASLKAQFAIKPFQMVYKLANPTPIQLSPTMVKALVGENHLSAPLDGQEITESEYRELFTWDEVEEYVNAHSGGGSGMNYSTEEQVVGTWIDGKPLYQKSISITGVSIPTNQTVTIYTQANIKMKYFSGYLTENDTTYVIPEVGVRIKQSGDNIQISSQSGASWTISEGYVTIRYTKTTD